MSRIDCILYPPTLDYNYLVQRPQQLMKNFSELGIPTFFLNEPSPGSMQERSIKKGNSDLYIFNHVDPRPYLRAARPVVYFSAAWHIDIVQQYNPALLVFDSVDEPSDEFEAWKPYYSRAVSLADIVLNTSDKLYEMSRAINPHSYLVPNGCDYNYFSQAADRNLPVPDDIAKIPGPIIGYIGVIASWLDLHLIERLAQQFPHCNVVMIGPLYNVSQIPRQPNLHWLGFKPYEQLAHYSQCFDVGIIPFIQSNMVDAVNPIKMWEYMASGIPVVSTAIPEARKYPDLVLYSPNNNEFLSNVQRALYQDSPEIRNRRMAVAEQNSWRHRAEQVVEIIEQRLEEKNHQPLGRDALFYDSLIEQGIAPHTGYTTQIISNYRRLSFSTRIALRISARGYVPLGRWAGKGLISGSRGIRFQSQAAYRYRTAKVH
ncbi:MAG TPA: glycosyltransferase [Syntrophomonadaceae bacterium]|nr:glycosyltransferase [Syntrophomonadaceae bacterium]